MALKQTKWEDKLQIARKVLMELVQGEAQSYMTAMETKCKDLEQENFNLRSQIEYRMVSKQIVTQVLRTALYRMGCSGGIHLSPEILRGAMRDIFGDIEELT